MGNEWTVKAGTAMATVAVELPAEQILELAFEANKRGLEIDQLITFWLELKLMQSRESEENYDRIG